MADLNKYSLSADHLLNYLHAIPGIRYIVLTDDANGGLLAKHGTGHPKASSGAPLNLMAMK